MSCLSCRRRLLSLALPLWSLSLLLASCAPSTPPANGTADSYLFCFWNAENFFDDKVDHHSFEADKVYDTWFADDAPALKQKLDNLTAALMKMNPGKGPDIIALAECENEHAVELLRDHLNAQITDKGLHFKSILYKDPKGGRAIATAILTRLDVNRSKTKLLGSRQRIMEGHITVNDHDLIIVAAHWTSRVSDKEGVGRKKYADHCYGEYKAAYKANPKVDFIVCGDFNDPPDEESVMKHLHAIGADKEDLEKVKSGGGASGPYLLDLMARPDLLGKKPQRGTHYYRGTWMTFDQICVSPGLLDQEGWSCDPDSMKIITDPTADRRGHPHRFGDKGDKIPLSERGYSDHFPVTVRLKVAGKE